MDSTPTSSLLPARLRLQRQSLSPYSSEQRDATPVAGPSRLSPLTPFLDGNDDDQSTPRMGAKDRLPSPELSRDRHSQMMLRLRTLVRGGDASTTQILNEPAPSITTGDTSEFEPPPRWNGGNASSTSSVRQSVQSLFSRALQDTPPRKAGGRRNSIDASDLSDSPHVERVAQERARHRGKRKSLSDDEAGKVSVLLEGQSMKSANSSARARAADLHALQDRIQNSFPKGHPTEDHSDRSASDMSMSDGDGNTDIGSEDTGELLRELNRRDTSTVSQIANNTQNTTALRSMAFGLHTRNDSDLLEADSGMQRAMDAMDSFDTDRSHTDRPVSFPPARPAKSPGLATRPLSMLGRAGSLTENQLMGNASRRVSGELSRRHSADVESLATSSQPSTPDRDRLQHHRNSHSHSGSPLPEPRSRRSSIVSLRDNDHSNGSSLGSMGDLRDRLRGERSEQDHERERSWNRPNNSAASAYLRQRMSFPPRSGSSLSSHSTHSTPDRSQHSSPAPTPDPEEIHEREFNWNNPRPDWSHSHSRTRTLSGDLGSPGPGSPSASHHHTLPPRSRTQSTSSLTHARRPSSALSTNSSVSSHSRASSPDPEKDRIREHNWNNPKPDWNRPPPRRSLSPLPPTPSSSTRPRATSLLSAHTPDRPSSRASSPVPPESTEKQHLRERNWGSHTPNWSSSSMHASRRSMSPLPPPSPSPSARPSISPRPSPSHARVRTQSGPSKPTTPPRAGGLRSNSSLGVSPPTWPAPPSPSPPRLGRRESAPAKGAAKEALAKVNGSTSARESPAVHQRKDPKPTSAKPSGIPKPGSSAGRTNGLSSIKSWSFPRKDASRIPDSDAETESLSSRSPSPVRASSRQGSHIPVRSPGKIPRAERHVPGTPAEEPPSSIFRRGHKRAGTEFSEANGAIPPRIVVQESEEDDEEEVRASLEEMDMSMDHDGHSGGGGLEPLRESDEDSNTPVLRPVVIPEVEESGGSEAPTPTQAEPLNGFEHEPEQVSEVESEVQQQSEGDMSSEEQPQEHLVASTTPDTTPAFVDADPESEAPSSPDTPPPAQPPSFSDLMTPPRRPSLFHTPAPKPPSPSPSKGLPELPPPPSDDEDEPILPPTQPNFSLMKTPRPPGGWISTPAPVPARPASTEPPSTHTNGRARSNSTGSPSEPPQTKGVLKTPAALNRASTLPTRTPAPPGGWINTPAHLVPATDKRKSVMKVRFEAPGSSESEVQDGGDETEKEEDVSLLSSLPLPAPVFDASWNVVNTPSNVNGSEQWGDAVADASLSEPSFAGVVSSSPAAKENQEPQPPSTPASIVDRRVRKSPSVRLMDEYGREKSTDPAAAAVQEKEAQKEKAKAAKLEKERIKQEEREKERERAREREEECEREREREAEREREQEREKEKERARRHQQALKERERSLRMPGGTLQTPRSKSMVRMLDAMGREVEDTTQDEEHASDSTITETRMTRSQAIERMRRAVSELKEGLDSADIDSEDERVEDARLAQLHEISRSAREHRDRLAASLRQAQEQKVKPKGSLLSRFTPKASISARQLLLISFTIFFAQCFLALYIYRLSHQHARDTFLSTYYDPFHPALYLNPDQPGEEQGRMAYTSSIVHTTMSSVSAAFHRAWRTRASEQSGSWPPT